MSQVYCPNCKCLCKRKVSDRCPTTLTVAPNWQCDGILVEHQCGGPQESCGIRGCEECHWPPNQEPERDALWHAIYAAEFVRLCGDMTMSGYADEKIREAAGEARALADWHHEVVPKEER